MRRFIKLAVHHPWSVIAVLLAVTVVLAAGLPRLRVEPSVEALMPKDAPEYRYNMRMKKVFGDSKLFMLTLIEPHDMELFSREGFVFMNEVVEEIEEFHEFRYDVENQRLQTVLRLGSVTWTEPETGDTRPQEDDGLISDEEIDRLLQEDVAVESEYFNVFSIDEPLPDDLYREPSRERRVYSYEGYTRVARSDLEDALDSAGNRQLATVLLRTGLDSVATSHLFSRDEYAHIVEEFETAYLYKSMEAVKSFMNPISGEDIIGTETALVPVDLVEMDDAGNRLLPESRDDFEAYREKLFDNPVFENNIYSLDESGSVQALAMNIQFEVIRDPETVSRYIMDLLSKYNTGALTFTTVGVPVFERYIQDYMKRDMRTFLPLVFLVVLITFFLNFRMARGVFLPSAAVLLSILWTMGLMGYLGIPITMVVNVLPTILVAVGSSYSIHVFNQFIHDTGEIRKEGKRPGLIHSMTRISATIFLAALTTFIGFSTLGFNQVISLKHFGIFSALGTVFAMIIAVGLIPAVLALTPLPKEGRGKRSGKDGVLQMMLQKVGAFTLKRPVPVLLVTALLLVFSVAGLSQLRIESSPTSNFKDDSYIVLADNKVSQLLAGTLTFNLMIDTGRDDGVKDPEFLRAVDGLADWIVSPSNRNEYQFLDSFTFADVIKRMNKAVNGGDSAYYTVPEEQSAVQDYIMLYSGEDRDSDGLVDAMERFVDPHYRVANIFIKTGSYDGNTYSTEQLLQGISSIQNHIEGDPYLSRLQYAFAGQTINFAVLNRLIARGQILTIILTLIIIGSIIYLLFRDIRASLVSLIPISCSILIVFGTMGYFGIPLDIAKSIIAAITIGIGIDDTIHMLKTIRTNLMLGDSLKDAIMNSYREAGIAIVYTSIALIFGFAVLMFSQFKVLFYFGWLVAFNMIATTAAALVVLPAAVWMLKIRFNIPALNDKTEKDGFEIQQIQPVTKGE